MGANGLLAVFAILIAWYTLLTDERRVDLKLRLSKLNIIFIIFLYRQFWWLYIPRFC